jgi:hypothetical protein
MLMIRTTAKVLMTAIALLALVAGAAACGGDDEDDGDDSGPDAGVTRPADAEDDADEDPTASPTRDGDDAPADEDEDEGEDDEDAGAGGGAVDACTLITDDEAATLLEGPLASVEVEAQPSSNISGCRWFASETVRFGVSVHTDNREDLDLIYDISAGEAEAVDGVGDAAAWFELPQILRVQAGDRDVIVAVALLRLEGEAAQEKAVEIAEVAVPRVPD